VISEESAPGPVLYLLSHAEQSRLTGDKYRRVTPAGNYFDKPVLREEAIVGRSQGLTVSAQL